MVKLIKETMHANGVIELRKKLFDDASMYNILRCAGMFHAFFKCDTFNIIGGK